MPVIKWISIDIIFNWSILREIKSKLKQKQVEIKLLIKSISSLLNDKLIKLLIKSISSLSNWYQIDDQSDIYLILYSRWEILIRYIDLIIDIYLKDYIVEGWAKVEIFLRILDAKSLFIKKCIY